MISSVPKTPRMLRLSDADNVLVAIDTVDNRVIKQALQVRATRPTRVLPSSLCLTAFR